VKLMEVHRRLEARRATDLPAKLLAPIGPRILAAVAELSRTKPAEGVRVN